VGNRFKYETGGIITILLVMTVASGLNAIAWLALGVPSPAWFVVIVGTILSIVAVVKYLRDKFVFPLIALIITALVGWVVVTLVPEPQRGLLLLAHSLWAVLFFGGMIAMPIIDRASSRASSRRAAARAAIAEQQRIEAESEAERQRIEANRQRELAYAQQVEREQNWSTHASRPGEMTGYEPAALEHVVIPDLPHMFGEPGAGLTGAGFNDASVARGQEGELNFAKSLVTAGVIDRFATFWSVHMPDAEVGASKKFSGDIDAVIVTGNSVWLLDMKNFNQGDVTWRAETRDTDGKSQEVLVAIDNVTGSYVGEPRPMCRNMKMATEVFAKKFAETGLPFQVCPAVVLMPRAEGIGVVDGVKWPGDIPTAPLHHVLSWLAAEPPFDPNHPDSQLITTILKVLVKDESGSAHIPGERRGAPRQHTAPVKAAALSAAPKQAPNSEQPVATATGRSCRDCGAPLDADQKLCFMCGLEQ